MHEADNRAPGVVAFLLFWQNIGVWQLTSFSHSPRISFSVTAMKLNQSEVYDLLGCGGKRLENLDVRESVGEAGEVMTRAINAK